MTTLSTRELEKYIAAQIANRGTVVLDEMVFANIPNLNNENLAEHLKMPAASQIVHRQVISQSGVVNENAVVYSVTMGTEVGDFDFNFIGLINREQNLLAVAVHSNTIKKIRNRSGIQGNSITRSILLEFSGAKALTNISLSAETWQIDFTARLKGLDEKIRLTNRDLYGRAVFFNEGFKVTRGSGQQYFVEVGEAYIEGVRAENKNRQTLTVRSLPCSIYVDVVHRNTVTGAYQTENQILQMAKNDWVDTAQDQHYVQIIADIDRNGVVIDRRTLSPFLGIAPKDLDENSRTEKDYTGHSHRLPLASLIKKGIVKLYSGVDSDSEEMAATPNAIKRLKALIDETIRRFDGFIPNSKKNNATNVDSSDFVATSRAVKAAYDKAVEAKTAADNANNNANGRVAKSGDTMTGGLTVPKLTLSQKTLSFGDDYFYKNNTGRELHGLHFVEDAGEPNDSSRGNGHFWAGNFHAQQTGQGSYAEQYRTQAPFYVDEINSASRDTYHPFIKGRVRRGGQYGAAFAFGYTTRQGEGDGFGRGIIELIEDNGTHLLWRYEHNGDFYSHSDVITGSGHSLNKCRERLDSFIDGNDYIKRSGNNHKIQMSWGGGDSGLRIKVDQTDLGRVFFGTERLLWEGYTDGAITVNAGTERGTLLVLMESFHSAGAWKPMWYPAPIAYCHDTRIGTIDTGGSGGDYNHCFTAVLRRNGTHITIEPLNDGHRPRIKKVVVIG